MADNYLENKMEEHQRRQAAGAPLRRSAAGRRAPSLTTLEVSYPELRVVVTNGASGIGRAIVEAFRKINAKVDFCDADRRCGAATAQATGGRFHPVDSAAPSDFEAMIARVIADRGDIDVVVNNFSTGLDPNDSAVNCLAAHRSSMSEPNRYGGRIINIVGEHSDEKMRRYSQAVAELAPWRITVNSITIPASLSSEALSSEALSSEALSSEALSSEALSKRVASLVLFLARPDSDLINGMNIPLDGGCR